MSLGPLMVGVSSTELSAEEREWLLHPQVGGVILFARNFADPAQLRSLVDGIHALRDPALLVAVDQEGGRVQRFQTGFTRLPPLAVLGRLHDRDAARALELAQTMGWLMAAEVRSCGVDISFAPVLDLDRGISSVIGDRAFHSEPGVVVKLADAYIKGMEQGGLRAIGKHFPGHGGVEADSHLDLPVDTRPILSLHTEDLVPFEELTRMRRLAGIMTAHVAYPDLDNQPASFSNRWINGLLRREFDFQGVVFCDDLGMEGASGLGGLGARALAALEAGNDMVMVCNELDNVPAVLETLEDRPVDDEAAARLLALRGPAGPALLDLQQDQRWEMARRAAQGLLDWKA
ncbi:MAG: beta-N-acetylhexosaminidase [Ectothiorhodospiraceae bacterium]|nr:beta-N-acetylhexosaminidase [Ectothiorhodospiraceae bacterium]MCH8503671.1 beta-N-acetylhexosaminidase [Ectothiorhodospiraceae bacterium]